MDEQSIFDAIAGIGSIFGCFVMVLALVFVGLVNKEKKRRSLKK